MFDELMAPAVQPFMIAAGIVAAIAVVELLALVFGIGLSSALDSLVPDVDLDAGGSVLSWLGFGQVPFLVVLIIMLATFSVAGLCIQWLAEQTLGAPLWPAVASVAALAVTLPVSARLSGWLGRLMPADESSGIHRDVLVGRDGVISQGVATAERTAEAEVVGPKGLKHWIRVRAEQGEAIQPGDPVRIIARESRVVFVARRRATD
ncbi:OB-fold-containig protein [Aquisalimonas asiatica]|uniref:Membrane protein implicated in regulation of membrane protease activity n=1 Tax=Aquisalimonas asiatica TaxID=406100 RepID=A0A1H8VHY6_9GAMM|nr:OB-fold-containig protein [Aquisalimonas asiatica]SEP14999.1 Protein of unknown function [Aquisalimonas asiatica]